MTEKLILDPTCGGRTLWFDKENPFTIYADIREAAPGVDSHRPNFHVSPDTVVDFREMPFEDESFKLVVWDPPHMKTLGETSRFAKKYGCLNAETWPADLSAGFRECWRVLDLHGVLIFKWNETEIALEKVLSCFDYRPLFGHTTMNHGRTHWMVFMKGVSDA